MAQLTLTLLGSPEIVWNDRPLRFAYKKATALLIYLALAERRAQSRSLVAGLLWPDVPEAAARQSLSQALTTVRQALGDQTAENGAAVPVILADSATLQLNPAISCSSDVAQVQALLAACERHDHVAWRTCAVCGERLQQAVALYQGDFLAQWHLRDSGAFEEWAAQWREQVREQALGALERLTEWAEWREDIACAITTVRRRLALDAWADPAHRELLRLLTLHGQSAAALAHYAAYARALAAEWGLEPEPTTRELAAMIRDDPATARMQARRFVLPVHLPQPPTPLIGRQRDVQTLVEYITTRAARALTISGPPGVGKTRLALAAADALRYAFADGIWWIELAPLAHSRQAPLALAQTLGVQERAHEALTTTLINALHPRHILLIFDNCEHLPDLAAFVATLLAACPQLVVLSTSRAPLQLRGERIYPLLPLALPAPDADAAAIIAADAVQLLAARVNERRPDLTVTPANAAAFAAICTRLDGLPLAVELIAGSVAALSLDRVVQQLAVQSALSVGGLRDLPDRQQTLYAAIAWSVERLTDAERRVFASTSVFAGSGTPAALQAVCGDGNIQPQLLALQRQSLLQLHQSDNGERWTMLETLRAYAQELPAAQHLRDTAAERLAHWLADLAEAASGGLLGEDGARWSMRIAAELPNLRAMQRWALERGARALALRMATGIWRFYWQRGYPSEGLAWLREGLALSEPIPPVVQMRALRAAGVLAMGAEQHAAAIDFLTTARDLALRDENSAEYGAAITNLGMVLREQGRLEEACRWLEEAVQVNRTMTDNPATVKFPLIILAGLYGRLGRIDEAAELYTECLAINRALNDGEGTANAFYGLAFVAHARGDYAQAQHLNDEAFALYASLHHQLGMGWVLALFGDIARDRGDAAAALDAYARSLTIWQACNNLGQASFVLDEAAALFLGLGAHRAAATLLSAAAALRTAAQIVLTPVEQAQRQQALEATRSALSSTAFAAAWAAGASLTLADAVQLCRGEA